MECADLLRSMGPTSGVLVLRETALGGSTEPWIWRPFTRSAICWAIQCLGCYLFYQQRFQLPMPKAAMWTTSSCANASAGGDVPGGSLRDVTRDGRVDRVGGACRDTQITVDRTSETCLLCDGRSHYLEIAAASFSLRSSDRPHPPRLISATIIPARISRQPSTCFSPNTSPISRKLNSPAKTGSAAKISAVWVAVVNRCAEV